MKEYMDKKMSETSPTPLVVAQDAAGNIVWDKDAPQIKHEKITGNIAQEVGTGNMWEGNNKVDYGTPKVPTKEYAAPWVGTGRNGNPGPNGEWRPVANNAEPLSQRVQEGAIPMPLGPNKPVEADAPRSTTPWASVQKEAEAKAAQAAKRQAQEQRGNKIEATLTSLANWPKPFSQTPMPEAAKNPTPVPVAEAPTTAPTPEPTAVPAEPPKREWAGVNTNYDEKGKHNPHPDAFYSAGSVPAAPTPRPADTGPATPPTPEASRPPVIIPDEIIPSPAATAPRMDYDDDTEESDAEAGAAPEFAAASIEGGAGDEAELFAGLEQFPTLLHFYLQDITYLAQGRGSESAEDLMSRYRELLDYEIRKKEAEHVVSTPVTNGTSH